MNMKPPVWLLFRLGFRMQKQKAAIAANIDELAANCGFPKYTDNPELYDVDGWGLVGTRLACNVKFTDDLGTIHDLGRVIA